MKRRGFFITLEGTDGVGKSTQARLLATWLRAKRRKVILTREPGGSPLAEKIRALLLDPRHQIEPRTELLLYEAARVEHVEKVIRPALRKGYVVLCDRFTDATYAYQGFGRGLNRNTIAILNRIATENLNPHLTLWLDLPPSVALKKTHARKKGSDRLEREGFSLQTRVRAGYAALARLNPSRMKRVLVCEEKRETQARLREIVSRRISL